MLLSQEANAIEYLARARARCFKPALEIGVFLFQLVDSFRIHARPACCGIEGLHSRLGLECAAAERCQLVTEMPDQLLKLLKGFYVRTFAV